MGAYEALWESDQRASFKSLADRFRNDPKAVPSDFVEPRRAMEHADRASALLKRRGVCSFGVRIHGAGEYPARLRDARHPVELLYYQGWWELAETRCIAVVGTREPTADGLARTKNLVRQLASEGYTIISGLAAGIDTAAHCTALECGAPTIAVLGTPIGVCYPTSNASLQKRIALDHLVVSQVPILRYEDMPFNQKRSLFPERNITMSALSLATIIVEASNTSGTLKQAQAALQQGRQLFILNSCFERLDLTWPEKFAEKGAIRVRDYADISNALNSVSPSNRSEQQESA